MITFINAFFPRLTISSLFSNILAVTSSDETNLLACLVAKNLGAESTIARVRGYEYNTQTDAMMIDFGMSMIINPEKETASEIKKILGLDRLYNMIVVGGGNIGQALVNYTNFEKRGFVIKAVFDTNPRLIGMTIRGVEVYDTDQMENYVKNNPVDVAILTLPRSQAVKVANDLAKWGVKGMWNFSHVDLQVPEDVLVENVHLTDSLMTLLYKINEMYYSGDEDIHEANLKNGLPMKPLQDNEEE